MKKYICQEISQYLSKIAHEVNLNEEYYNKEGKEVLIILIEQILTAKIGEEKTKEIEKGKIY